MATKFLNGLDLANQKVINVADPTSNTDGANKQYVDAVARGLSWKASVRAASTANVTVSSAPSTLDGITLVANDRVLLKDQTTGTENGIYVFSAAASPLTRAADLPASNDARGVAVSIDSGTVNNDRVYLQTADPAVVGTNALAFSQLGGSTTYSAGNGLQLSSNTFSVLAADSSINVAAGGISIASAAAGAGLGLSAGVLSVNTSTGLEVSGDNVRLAAATGTGLTGGGASALAVDTAVVARKYATTIGDGSSTSIAVTHSLGTQDVLVQVLDATTHAAVMTDWVATSTSVVTLTFATAPASSAYRVVVHG